MAEERGQAREYPAWRPKPASWTKLFGTFLVALDPFKLLVAAAGILATALGWWLISLVFYNAWTVPNDNYYEDRARKNSSLTTEEERAAWANSEYHKARDTWALMHELAGPTDRANELYAKWYAEKTKDRPPGQARNMRLEVGKGGKYRLMPWDEDRGPNPFLMTKAVVGGTGDERSLVLTWFFSNQVPNLVEPLLKFLTPVYYLFDTRATFWVYVYLLLLILWLLVVWAFFGGVITRMAVLQLSGKEGGGLREAVSYVRHRYLSYLLSPIVPIGLIGFLVLCCMLFGILHWAPLLGDLIDGLFWWLPLLAGLVMTLLLVGMVGYPMMYTTLSAEGSDTFDALSRSYNYVYESPWHYLWYSAVAVAYGAVLTLFVVIVGSLTTYFAKWGVAKFPAWGADRSPEYLFIYAPESLGWRKLMLEGSPAAITDAGEPVNPPANAAYMNNYAWWNHMGAGMVSFWVTLVFMMVIGFSYSYFWTAATQIYLLMRKRVDETEMDEVYVEEEAPESPAAPAYPTPSPTPTPTGPASVPVDAPTLRQPETPPPAAAPSPPAPPPEDRPPTEPSGDGAKPAL
ncbi:MAG TPA: hypothetical protein VKE40_12460 [Gemmataceae bacterium]|nr:hypothetical protein [Gemmataceae bacterium]